MIQLKNKNILIICLFVLAYGCSKTKSKEEFIEEVQKGDKYNKEVSVNNYRIKVGVRPSSFLALQELRNNNNDATFKKMYQDELKKFENGMYVDFSISLMNGEKLIPKLVSTPEDYSFLMGELNYLIKDNLVAFNNSDTIKALYCNYTNTYNNSKEIRLTYCFSKKSIDKTDDKELCFEYIDKLFGLQDKVKLCFDKNETLNQQVKIKDIDE